MAMYRARKMRSRSRGRFIRRSRYKMGRVVNAILARRTETKEVPYITPLYSFSPAGTVTTTPCTVCRIGIFHPLSYTLCPIPEKGTSG